MKYIIVIATIILNLIIVGYSNSSSRISNAADILYAAAYKQLKHGKYKEAIEQLKVLDAKYPLSLYTQQVQLDLIYAYYKATDWVLAQYSIDRFLRFHPTSDRMDYVLYMRGLIDMARDECQLHKLFGVECSDRDPKYARTALHYFNYLIHFFPESKYSKDANQHIVYLKNRIAKNELAIIKFYYKKGAYFAVKNRVEQMLYDFPETTATNQALYYMDKASSKLITND